MSAGSSLSILRSVGSSLSQTWSFKKGRGDLPLNTFGHSRTDAHSIQCSGRRGVLAIVQIGNAVGGVCMWSWKGASSHMNQQSCEVGEGKAKDAPCTRSNG